MNKYVWTALAAIAVLSGCAKEVLSEPSTSSETSGTGYLVTFTAERVADDALTRACISPEDSKIINWSEGDEISIFDAAGHNCRFTLKEGAGTPTAVFEGTVTEVADSYTALYPYHAKAELEVGNNGSLHFNIIENVPVKTEQKAVEGSFDPEAAIMTARSESGSSHLQFRNLMGFIKLTPKSDCSKITFTPANWPEGVPCGDCQVVLEKDASWIPRLGGYGSAESISISGDIKAGKSYYIAAATRGWSLSFPKGFFITFSTDEIDTFKRTSKALEIKRNTVTNLGEIEGVPEPSLKFTADDEQSFSFDGDCSKFQYSVAYGAWEDLTSDAVTFGGYEGDLRLRGKSETGTWNADAQKGTISFAKEDVKVRCSGDIRTLIDWENYKTVATENARFTDLFINCKALLTAPELPLKILAPKVYWSMFENCVSLSSCPDLPAESAPVNAYRSMFQGCTSITAMPEISATSIGTQCMERMFAECGKLQTATDLKVTEFTGDENGRRYCTEMFLNCTNLKNAPALPAVNLRWRCYTYMFQGCKSLEKAPALPARILAPECYGFMFSECTDLVEAPVLTIDSADEGESCKCMFNGCSSLKSMTIDIGNLPDDGIGRNQFGSWLKGTAADGVLHIRKGLNAFTKENLCCPENWTMVEDITD